MNAQDEITIGLAGDVMIGRYVNEYMHGVPPKYIWGDLIPVLHSNDLNLINLEAALTTCKQKVPKVFNFRADPSRVQALTEGSIDIVNLANNHILDYTEKGLFDTLATLDAARIQHVGAGKDKAEAFAPRILMRRDIRIGIIGCTDNEPTWEAKEDTPGVCFLEVGDIEVIRNTIKDLRSKVELLILTIHWGPNMRRRPSNKFQNFAHQLIDLGVDIIHGHSAHIFQGVEVYKNKLILYDTGDFVDDYYVDPLLRNDQSFLFLVKANKARIVSLMLIPVLIENCQANRAKGKDAREILESMQSLSAEFKTKLTRENEELFLEL